MRKIIKKPTYPKNRIKILVIPSAVWYQMTNMQKEIHILRKQGMSFEKIATKLSMAPKTAYRHYQQVQLMIQQMRMRYRQRTAKIVKPSLPDA